MVAAILAIVMALISYFGAKKSGASDGEAALAGAAVGAGTYYVGAQTEWGKGAVDKIETWVGVKDSTGADIVNKDGVKVQVPKGAEIQKNPDGTPMLDAAGNVMWKLVDSTGKVLTSWGGVGTAAVIGAAGVATGKIPSWVLPVGIGAGLLILLR